MVNYLPIIGFFREKEGTITSADTSASRVVLSAPLQQEDKNSPERGVSEALLAHCHQDGLDLLTLLLCDCVGRQFSVDLGVFIAKGTGVKKTHMK